MDSVPSGLFLTAVLAALVGLAAQTALLKQLVNNANRSIKRLEDELAARS